jgi:hypothetical protein
MSDITPAVEPDDEPDEPWARDRVTSEVQAKLNDYRRHVEEWDRDPDT